MRKSDLEDLTFFKNKEGEWDYFALQLNCFEASVYNILINSFKLERKLAGALFIRDINPTFWCNRSTGSFRLYNYSSNINPLWRKYVKVNQYVLENEKNSILFIEELLDKGNMVILETVFDVIPFYVNYNPEFKLSDFYPGDLNHNNIILFHDEEYFYYVEKVPYTITKENYIPYELNEQIGVIPKSEMVRACSYYTKCSTLEIDLAELNGPHFKKDISELIHSIARNFETAEVQDGQFMRYCGKQAMERFAEYCEEGHSLEGYYRPEGWKLITRICFDLWMIHGARTIMYEYVKLINENTDYSGDLELLTNKIYQVRMQWELLETIFTRLVHTNRPLDAKLGKRIREQLVAEAELNELLMLF